jgi:Co/Zn/Cd efflux system component
VTHTTPAYRRALWTGRAAQCRLNLAVVLAAVAVWLAVTPWPDLLVAVGIAGLFLHSAWEIIDDARSDLTRAEPQPAH